jgi:hypothetical protein
VPGTINIPSPNPLDARQGPAPRVHGRGLREPAATEAAILEPELESLRAIADQDNNLRLRVKLILRLADSAASAARRAKRQSFVLGQERDMRRRIIAQGSFERSRHDSLVYRVDT